MNAAPSPNRFLEGPILVSLVALAVPIVLTNLLQAGYQLIDAFWVGRLGGEAVAAVSVSFPVIFLSIALGTGLAVAGSTLIAQYVGAKQQAMVNHVAAQTLLMIALVSLALGALGYLLAPFLLSLMGVEQAVHDSALGFMRVSFIGLVFTFTFFMFQSIMRGIGETTLPIYIVAATVALNFALDPLFIFGWGPVPALGVMGAALATLGTQCIAALIGLVVLFRGRHGIQLGWKDFAPDVAYIKRAFFLGFPASIEMSARALALTVMTFLIASFGTLAVASYGVSSNVIQVIIIPAMGLSMAISILVGQNIGAGNVERAARIGRLGAWLSFWLLSAVGLLVFAFAPQLVAFFVPDEAEVIAGGAAILRIMCLSWGFLGAQIALTGVLRAAGNMVVTMVLTLVSQWVIQFPLAYVLSKHTDLAATGIWWAFPVTNVLTVLITLAIYAKGDWKKTRLIDPEEKLTEQVSEEIIAEEAYANR
ncbi:MAG TPA: MATE family efflux transporter [Candidatus Paceibacterota bacterium]|nr:MATE family efflux transporter [Candidatus Paceibacterota bacterium]